MLELPQPAVRREGEAIGRAVAGAPGLRRRQVRPGEGVGPDHRRGLGRFRVGRRVDHRHARRADLSGHGVAGSRPAVQREVQDLAQRLVGILGGGEALTVADRQVQGPAVGREGDLRPELAALAALAVPPDHLQAVQARGALAEGQPGPGQRQAGASVAGLGIGEVDGVVRGVMGRQEDAQKAALSLGQDGRRVGDRRLAAGLGHQPDMTRLLGNQHAPVGQEGQAPGQVEGRHGSHHERRAGLGGLRAGIHLGVGELDADGR